MALLNATLTGYTIMREVGHGSMGVVYEARQQGVERRVAIKVLPPNMALRERTVKRFLREAEAMGRISHPNIVDIHEVGSVGSLHYFSMRFVEGPPLDRVLKAGPLAIDDVLAIGIDVASALAHAHARGVLHRDVKPSNLLRDRERVVLTDFGLARPLDQEEAGTMTESGDMVGTPLYMSPEQISGDTDRIDARSDVWGLGATLYELLTQRPPFQGANAQTILNSILHKEPPLLRKLRDDVPRDLEAVLLKCLEKDLTRRYSTAAALLEDLRAVREGRPVSARPPRFFDPVTRWFRRNPGVAAGYVAMFVVAGVLAMNWRSSRTAVESERVRNADAEKKSKKLTDSKRLSSAHDELRQAQTQWENGGEEERAQALDRVFDLINTFDQRDPALAVEGLEVFGRWGRERAESNELEARLGEFRTEHPDATPTELSLFARWVRDSNTASFADAVRAREQAVIDLIETRLIANLEPARALQYRAAMQSGLGRLEDALRVEAECARIAPHDPAPLLAAARIQLKIGMRQRDANEASAANRSFRLALNSARTALNKSIVGGDEEIAVNALIEVARAELDLGQPDAAIADLTLAARRDDTRAEVESMLKSAEKRRFELLHPPEPLQSEVAPVATAEATPTPSGATTAIDKVVPKVDLQSTKTEIESAARGVQSIYQGLRDLLTTPRKDAAATTAPGSKKP